MAALCIRRLAIPSRCQCLCPQPGSLVPLLLFWPQASVPAPQLTCSAACLRLPGLQKALLREVDHRSLTPDRAPAATTALSQLHATSHTLQQHASAMPTSLGNTPSLGAPTAGPALPVPAADHPPTAAGRPGALASPQQGSTSSPPGDHLARLQLLQQEVRHLHHLQQRVQQRFPSLRAPGQASSLLSWQAPPPQAQHGLSPSHVPPAQRHLLPTMCQQDQLGFLQHHDEQSSRQWAHGLGVHAASTSKSTPEGVFLQQREALLAALGRWADSANASLSGRASQAAAVLHRSFWAGV